MILASNYGSAGALDRYGGDRGLPQAYSGHNSYWEWGPPPETATNAVVVGYDEALLRAHFASVTEVARIDNGVDLDDDEQGRRVYVCRDRQTPWEDLWPALRRLG